MKKIFLILIPALALLASACSDDNTSYADLLNDENKAVNRYLADQRVEASIPADTVFETGINAPYYQLDEDGNIFMQVIQTGDLDDKPADDQVVYFRFMMSNLSNYTTAEDMYWEGNSFDLDQYIPTSFRFNNFTLQSSYQYGSGIQMPLNYLGYNSEVYIVIKSQYGFTQFMSSVQPFVYHVRYYKAAI